MGITITAHISVIRRHKRMAGVSVSNFQRTSSTPFLLPDVHVGLRDDSVQQ